MGEVTLERYQAQERTMAVEQARRGLAFHVGATVLVIVVVVLVNVFVAPEFPWAIFPAAGMSLGVWFHWHFGVRHGDEVVRRHQEAVEHEAERHAA
jgi:hypothetical protein